MNVSAGGPTVFSIIEREVICLRSAQELLDLMVNYEMLELLGSDPNVTVMFKTSIHQKYFIILLLDFLSPASNRVTGDSQSCLEAIQAICKAPSFNENRKIDSLTLAVSEFSEWLQQEVRVKTWLPSIEVDSTLSLRRSDFIKLCGNISKHNFSRLSGVADDLLGIFKKNRINVDFRRVLLTLGDFYQRFHSDILNYHGSTIAEFLNNIRLGIYEYLQPEYTRSLVIEGGDPPKYRYMFPQGVTEGFAENCYWELMNWVRSGPYMRKFQVLGGSQAGILVNRPMHLT